MKSPQGADILVVDDEADIRELVSGILQDEGYSVRSAPDSDAVPMSLGVCISVQPFA